MDTEQTESHTKPASSGFEYLAFSITRYFVLILTFLALLSVIIAAGIFIYNFTGSSSVSYSDVQQRLYGGNYSSRAGGGAGGQQSYSGQAPNIPLAVRVWFNQGNNTSILNGWISNVAASEKQNFVDGLEKVIVATQQNGASTADAVNTYKELWFEKKASGLIGKAYAITLLPYAGIAFGIFAVLSIILALLAIERNTRSRV